MYLNFLKNNAVGWGCGHAHLMTTCCLFESQQTIFTLYEYMFPNHEHFYRLYEYFFKLCTFLTYILIYKNM